jgi:hypothetical protein
MNPHLAKAIKLYESHCIDIKPILDWHLCNGIVICNPDAFALCFHTVSHALGGAVDYEHSDTLFVTMCCGNTLRSLRPLKDLYRFISFQRGFKNSERFRLLDMERFYSKIKQHHGIEA